MCDDDESCAKRIHPAWAERHRPRRFADLAGLGSARTFLQDQVRTRQGRSVLLYGPAGCGKTSVAEIYATALLCGRGAEPCLSSSCIVCAQVSLPEVSSLTRWTAGTKDDRDLAREVVNAHRYHNPLENRAVVLIDRADRLDVESADLIHASVEHLAGVTFIACAVRLDGVPPRLAALLRPVPVTRADVGQRAALLRRICAAEALDPEPQALELLARCASGGLRGMIRDLETLAGRGPLTDDHVGAFYGLGSSEPLSRYLAALLAGQPLAAQLTCLERWDVSVTEKAQAIEQTLGEAFAGWVGCVDIAAIWLHRTRMRDALVAALDRQARTRRVTPRQLWEELLSLWEDGARIESASALLRRLSASDGLLNGIPGAHLPLPRASGSLPAAVGEAELKAIQTAMPTAQSRGRRRVPREPTEIYLGVTDACALLDAASYMVQAHGLCLNTRFIIRYRPLGLESDKQISACVVRLVRRLRARYETARSDRRSEVQLLYVHGTDPVHGPETRFVATLPDAAEETKRWLRSRFLRGTQEAVPDFYHDPSAGQRDERAMQTHLELLRWLCAGIEPDAAVEVHGQRESTPLIEMLGISRSERYKPGPRPTQQRCGVSRLIDHSARQAFPDEGVPIFYTTRVGQMHHLTSLWELREFRYRADFMQKRPNRETWEDGILTRCNEAQRGALEAEFTQIVEAWRAGSQARCCGRPISLMNGFKPAIQAE